MKPCDGYRRLRLSKKSSWWAIVRELFDYKFWRVNRLVGVMFAVLGPADTWHKDSNFVVPSNNFDPCLSLSSYWYMHDAGIGNHRHIQKKDSKRKKKCWRQLYFQFKVDKNARGWWTFKVWHELDQLLWYNRGIQLVVCNSFDGLYIFIY